MNPEIPIGRVLTDLLTVRTNAKRNSCHATMKAYVAVAIIAGIDMGMTIRNKIPNREHPSTQAASSTSFGILAKKPLSIHVVIGKVKIKYENTNPYRVS
jgi:hypothetical protein